MNIPTSLYDAALLTARCLSPAARERMCEFTERERDALGHHPDASDLDVVAKAFREVIREAEEARNG